MAICTASVWLVCVGWGTLLTYSVTHFHSARNSDQLHKMNMQLKGRWRCWHVDLASAFCSSIFMSLVIHYWIGDVSASKITYIVSSGALTTHSLQLNNGLSMFHCRYVSDIVILCSGLHSADEGTFGSVWHGEHDEWSTACDVDVHATSGYALKATQLCRCCRCKCQSVIFSPVWKVMTICCCVPILIKLFCHLSGQLDRISYVICK